MNSMERVQALMTGKPFDRRPYTALLSLYGAAMTRCPLDTYYNDPAAFVRGQAAVRELFQPDVLFAPVVVSAIAEAFGSKVRYSETVAPVVVAPAIESAAEWDRIPIPDPDRHPRLRYLREGLRRMVAEHQGQVPIAVVLLAPIDLASLIIGLDEWMQMLLFDRPAAVAFMRRLTPFVASLTNRCFEDGAAFAAWPTAFASPAIVTREIVAQFSRPVLAESLAALKGPVVLHHLDGPLLPHLDLLAGLPNLAGFGVAQGDDLGQARAAVGPRSILLSGPAAPWLRTATVPQIEAVCQAALEDRAADPLFILSTSKADVLYDTPPQNVRVLREAVESFARRDA